MKISDIKIYTLDAFRTNWAFIKVETDEGLYGWGEASLGTNEKALEGIASDVLKNEPDFCYSVAISKTKNVEVFSAEFKTKIIEFLLNTPNGVLKMSDDVQGLVETSLNLGILKTENDSITLQYALRSNKQSGLDFLEEKMTAYFEFIPCAIETFGHYPPWEFNSNSSLQELYKNFTPTDFYFRRPFLCPNFALVNQK